MRLLIESPSEVTDPAKTFSAEAAEAGIPRAYQQVEGHPAIVGQWVDEPSGQTRSEGELVIGSAKVVVQGYQSADAFVAAAKPMLRR